MYKVTFKFEDGEDVEAFVSPGESLLEVARKTNVAIDAPCSGNGACGKCRVQLLSGELDTKKNPAYFRGRICPGLETGLYQ